MKNGLFLYRIFLILVSVIAIFAICIAIFFPPVEIPETEDITKFESVDIELSDNSDSFSYSFIPDGSGILYVDAIPVEYSGYLPAKFIYYHLDFKSKHLKVIHEIVIRENDFDQQDTRIPVVYWQGIKTPFLGIGSSYGDCSTDILYDAVTFNLNTNEKTPTACPGGVGLTNPEIDTKHPNLITRSNPNQYKEIHSADKQYYFLWKIESDCVFLGCFAETATENYLEIYNSEDKMIRKIYLGKTGMTTVGPLYTGYTSFWSNINQIVLIPASGNVNNHSHYKIYFIDPEK
jgi:hypothetical protein